MISCLFKLDVMSKAVIIPECNKDIGGMKDEISTSPPEKREGAMGLFSRLLRLDTLKRSAAVSPTPTEPLITYYGVYIPCEIKKGPDEEAIHVYENKAEALELVRRYKQGRFKAFHDRKEAVSFALRGAEPADTTDGNDSSLMGEKPYPFKAPSPQDMVALRKSIEKGLLAAVRERVWDNPRYLVSSGNTPAIMQEGSRYNALHVAAKALNAEMCNLVLTTVGNPAFVQTLYGLDADADCCKEFAAILVDRYLNTPDKGMNETPLHFAAKFGAEACVDVLTSFPQCNKQAINKFGEQPKDIICKRANNASPECARRMSGMLEERFYVPVLHAEDGSAAPAIGRAFTPAQPPEINLDPLSPRYEIRAFAGPMAARDADTFRRKWKTPPRLQPPAFRLREITKGLETVGRNLAEEMKVGWKEYWPFLDTFTDLRTPEGLALLENYLKTKYESACSFAYSDSCAQSQSPDDISLSRISLGNLGNLSQTPSKQNSVLSPMSELCVAMKTCTISSDRPAHWKKTDPIRQRMCRQPTKALTNGDVASPTPNHPNHSVSQLVCIERTCQVFAKRIADALTFSLTSEPEVAGESLKAEAKYLQHTMYTYMDDERFQNINFALIHSRLAQLAVFMLKRQTKDTDDVNSLAEFLVKLRCPNDDIFSSDDEHKSARGPSRLKMSHVLDNHIRCLAGFISEELTESEATKGPSVSESECAELWGKASKCRCDWKIENFERNSKKNASFRKNRSILSTSPKSESLVRRLTFDCDIGDGKSQRNESSRPLSVNSPGGDSAPGAVRPAEISEDESGESCNSDEYHTASEHSDDDDKMVDASDRALAEPFIYGEEPSKMDRLVFDALAPCSISPESYPNVYRWRHTVALYSPTERDKWAAPDLNASVVSLGCCSPLRRAALPAAAHTPRARCSTPNHRLPPAQEAYQDRSVPLQVSNWLRVTGPNSPRSALATKQLGHNVSFGF
ncbi:ankyrin repeat and LEM domain-containing protein 2 [Cydia pomonella]|uniref:ankyrin repeat and LEM domain-containing protein 2 n=1 Tax=Cydia pomonella TaxID=82600 RepID=UPI002ADDC559|nr:ankyrin repeat and LEM domain-containing protein 2 [Cydia pomonella]